MGLTWQTLQGNTSIFAVSFSLADGAEEDWVIEEAERTSWGSFALLVHDTNLCAHVEQGEAVAEVHWYLLPIAEWLVENWDALFHEERLPLGNDSSTGAAALARTSYIPPSLELEEQVRRTERWQAWWDAHSLRAAASGALVPDVVIRRWGDEVEFSVGLERQPGIPDHFTFDVPAKVWRVPVARVAGQLYEALGELLRQLAKRCPESRRLAQLQDRWAALRGGEISKRLALLGGAVSNGAPDWLAVVLDGLDLDAALGAGESVAVEDRPQVLALFGSYKPEVSADDVKALLGLVQQAETIRPNDATERLFSFAIDPSEVLGLPPGEQGSFLGEEAYDRLIEDGGGQRVDVQRLVEHLGVSITDTTLSDKRVRAVSLLADGAAPLIAVNENYERGRGAGVFRFTLAHELAHLLLDRHRSCELAIVSGPWAPLDIEQRANAFAAALLMPEGLVRRASGQLDAQPSGFEAVRSAAQRLGVSVTSLADRMRNLGMLTDDQADAVKGDAAYRRQTGRGEA